MSSGNGAGTRHRAVVIGSGFGGLAAAVRLLARGYRVEVLEALDQPGGRARVFEQDGFKFDAGPTVITAPFLLEELWELLGESMSDHVELVPVNPFYQIRFSDGHVFNYTGDSAAMAKEIAKVAPEDVEGYHRFVEESERIFDVGFTRLGDVPFSSFTDMMKIVPDMISLQSYRTVYGFVSKFLKSEKMRQVLSFHPLLVGGNPFSTTSIYALIAFLERKWGVHYSMGGTGALVRGLVSLVERHGGQVHLNSPVAQINVGNGRATGVTLESGEQVPADVVISNADAATTYKRLLSNHKRRRWTDGRINRSRYSMSLFVWYFGTDRKYENVEHHTILLGPRYEGLLRDIFDHKVLADDFSLYLHRPTATDASMAPDGCDAFYVLSPVPHLDSEVDWEKTSAEYSKKIGNYLERTVLPDLSRHLVTSHVLTPIQFRDELSSEKGAAFSLEPILRQSAWFRPHNESEELDGLYLVGAGTHPGAGVPGVISSARVLDKVVPDVA